jgi:hypothetical protein
MIIITTTCALPQTVHFRRVRSAPSGFCSQGDSYIPSINFTHITTSDRLPRGATTINADSEILLWSLTTVSLSCMWILSRKGRTSRVVSVARLMPKKC